MFCREKTGYQRIFIEIIMQYLFKRTNWRPSLFVGREQEFKVICYYSGWISNKRAKTCFSKLLGLQFSCYYFV